MYIHHICFCCTVGSDSGHIGSACQVRYYEAPPLHREATALLWGKRRGTKTCSAPLKGGIVQTEDPGFRHIKDSSEDTQVVCLTVQGLEPQTV